WWNEGLHGVARSGLATVFPQAIGFAATWDSSLVFRMATVISDEFRAKHEDYVRRGEHQRYQGLTVWSPNINLFRDPRWGRGQETYGEDPYLTGRMAVPFIRGLQGDDPKYFKTIATVKHFAVHSGPEPLRHAFDAVASTAACSTPCTRGSSPSRPSTARSPGCSWRASGSGCSTRPTRCAGRASRSARSMSRRTGRWRSRWPASPSCCSRTRAVCCPCGVIWERSRSSGPTPTSGACCSATTTGSRQIL